MDGGALQALSGLEAEAHGIREVLAFFDDLPPVNVPSMLGSWRGGELATGNPMDGLLGRYGWYGKRFDGPEDAHPLIFQDDRGRFAVSPAGLPMSLVARHSDRFRNPRLSTAAKKLLRLRRTRSAQARLRMIEYRGVVTATMVYDNLPINDHFRRVDQDTVLGAMDLRGLEEPFMFTLRRETRG